MKMTGAEIVCHTLVDEGVTDFFGLPGGSIIPVYDALIEFPQLNHILARHEQGATHMADGYTRSTGKVGVVMVTSGPGATNCVTGILNAYMDSIPLVLITGQVALPKIGQDSFQEADTCGITRPCTKHNYLVTDVNELGKIMRQAFYIARTGRPGPVLIDLPMDIQKQTAIYDKNVDISIRGYNPKTRKQEGHSQQIEKVVKAIKQSKKPVIFAGHGVILSGASEELTSFARKTQIPVTSTILGLGAFPETDPLSLGMLGMHGTWYANNAVNECDLLINIGSRFDDRITSDPSKFAPNAQIVHIDIDTTNISKVMNTHYPVVGDAKSVLMQLIPKVDKIDTSEWLKIVYGWKMEHPLSYELTDKIRPQYIIEKFSELVKGNAIVATDVGQHQMWVAQHFKFTRPRTMISSGGLGTMGFGFPAAIGAAVGNPEETVICFSGDGSFQMNVQELATAVKFKLGIKVVILNNGFLGMVRQWQDMFWDQRFSQVLLEDANPDFAKLAEVYGGVGFRAVKTSEVEPILRESLKINDRPVVMNFIIPREEKVFPMIPAGQSAAEIIDIR